MQESQPYIYPDGRMKPKDAAVYTGFSGGTLSNWRVLGKGPRFIKRGARIFYFKNDLDEWMISSGFCYSTAQAELR
jgi:hypothetical protein